MKIQFLEPEFAVADAVYPEDMREVQEQGFRTVICNRRESEEDYEGERAYAEAAEAQGLRWVSIPVASGEYPQRDIEAFGKALDTSASPILAFCRTGRRAVHMWAQSRAMSPQCNIPDLLKAAHEAGHDPQPIRDLLGQ
jgi:uncharacterized protein (TIGR01244 family)